MPSPPAKESTLSAGFAVVRVVTRAGTITAAALDELLVLMLILLLLMIDDIVVDDVVDGTTRRSKGRKATGCAEPVIVGNVFQLPRMW